VRNFSLTVNLEFGAFERHIGVLMACWFLGFFSANGQSGGDGKLRGLQDSLVKLGRVMYNEPSEPGRLEANFAFVKTLVSALKTPHSYSFAFDSVDMVSILQAPDDRFRIFSWHIPLNDGSYLYYGAVQLNTVDGSLKLYPLLDKTYEIESPETVVTGADNWYGAQYYRIVPLDDAYVLLGWKGHTPQQTQKVIEVLRLTGTDVQLGKAIFAGEDTERLTRMIYRYNRNVSMYMDYDRAENRIVLDHLAPSAAEYEGQYEQYGPDMTYDAWQLEGSKLVLIPDIPLLNPPDSNDERYNDPEKPLNHPKSGLSIP